MNVPQIKEVYSMKDILHRCNIKIHRGGFCTCVFHSGDNTPSMKVYDKGYYCFACGKGGDLIDFVQNYHGLSFNDACKWISGEELTKSTKQQIAYAKIRRDKQEKRRLEGEKELKEANQELTGLWQECLRTVPTSELDPFPEEWTEAYNKWQLACYKQEEAVKMLGG
jgi:DNA primase